MSCCCTRVDVSASRRRAIRSPISETGSAVSIEGSRSVVVEDIGRHGARIRGHKLPGVGKQVLIWTDGLDMLGSVVWARFGVRGVAFEATPSKAPRLEKMSACGSMTFAAAGS